MEGQADDVVSPDGDGLAVGQGDFRPGLMARRRSVAALARPLAVRNVGLLVTGEGDDVALPSARGAGRGRVVQMMVLSPTA